MATKIEPTTETLVSAIEQAWKPYRLNVKQFLAMIDADIFPDDAHVELLEGVMIEMMTKSVMHDYVLGALSETLRRHIPEDWLHRENKSLQLDPRSRPVPDVAIVGGPRRQYSNRTPPRPRNSRRRRGFRIHLFVRPRREMASLRCRSNPDILDCEH